MCAARENGGLRCAGAVSRQRGREENTEPGGVGWLAQPDETLALIPIGSVPSCFRSGLGETHERNAALALAHPPLL